MEMTTTTEPRRDALTGRPLRNVEALAIQMLIEEIEEVVKEVAIISDEEKLAERLFEILTDQGAGTGHVRPTLPCRLRTPRRRQVVGFFQWPARDATKTD